MTSRSRSLSTPSQRGDRRVAQSREVVHAQVRPEEHAADVGQERRSVADLERFGVAIEAIGEGAADEEEVDRRRRGEAHRPAREIRHAKEDERAGEAKDGGTRSPHPRRVQGAVQHGQRRRVIQRKEPGAEARLRHPVRRQEHVVGERRSGEREQHAQRRGQAPAPREAPRPGQGRDGEELAERRGDRGLEERRRLREPGAGEERGVEEPVERRSPLGDRGVRQEPMKRGPAHEEERREERGERSRVAPGVGGAPAPVPRHRERREGGEEDPVGAGHRDEPRQTPAGQRHRRSRSLQRQERRHGEGHQRRSVERVLEPRRRPRDEGRIERAEDDRRGEDDAAT